MYLVASAGALIFLYLRTFALPAVPFVGNGDELLFFVRALRIAHGEIVYRDFFELVTPGTDLLYAAGFKLFGVHAWLLQAWTIMLGLALSYIVTSLARRILRGPAVFLPALMFLVFDFASLDATHHWYSTLAALAAARALMCRHGLGRVVTAGLLCGVATLFTQTQGCLTLLALMTYLLIEESAHQDFSLSTKLLGLLLPYVLLCSSVLGYYMYRAGSHTVFFDLFVFPVKYLSSGSFNSPQTYLHQFPSMHGFSGLVRLVPYLLIYSLVPYVYLYSLYHLWRRRNTLLKETRQRLILLNLVGCALFLAISTGPRFFRLSTVAPPAILICVWLLYQQQGHAFRATRYALWLVAVAFAVSMPLHRQMEWHGILSLPIGQTAFTNAVQMQEFQWLKQRTRPGDRFFGEYALGLYLQLTNPAHIVLINNNEFTRPEDVTQLVQSLQQAPPKFIVVYPQMMGHSDVHDHSVPYQIYVRQHYCPLRRFEYDPDASEEIWGLRGPSPPRSIGNCDM
jgi:4-amino-4-deoxy-L-arabinose transferase-like glycosyltransferase